LVGITDGSSNTWMVAEQSDHLRDSVGTAIPGPVGAITSQGIHGWTMGAAFGTAPATWNDRHFNCTTVRYQINQRGMADNGAAGTNQNTGNNIPLSSNHTGGINVLFADGTVRFYTNATPTNIMGALCTRAGGEIVSIDP
jgi:prepilin-type processing-associated H-X9-DG protein